MQPPKYLIVGQILRPHGVQGELKIRLMTDYPERIRELGSVLLGRTADTDQVTTYQVERLRLQPEFGILKLEGIDDRDQAERLRMLLLLVTVENAVPLEEGEYYLFQLIGMTVKTQDGETLGTVSDVLETGANDVYIVDSPKHGEVLIPVTDETVLETDPKTRVITVKLPDGLLPDP